MLPPKVVYLPISKLHSILTVANLIAHNNISQICCYCVQISLQSATVNFSFCDTFRGHIYFAGDSKFSCYIFKRDNFCGQYSSFQDLKDSKHENWSYCN